MVQECNQRRSPRVHRLILHRSPRRLTLRHWPPEPAWASVQAPERCDRRLRLPHWPSRSPRANLRSRQAQQLDLPHRTKPSDPRPDWPARRPNRPSRARILPRVGRGFKQFWPFAAASQPEQQEHHEHEHCFRELARSEQPWS